jgi:hypothetical protein
MFHPFYTVKSLSFFPAGTRKSDTFFYSVLYFFVYYTVVRFSSPCLSIHHPHRPLPHPLGSTIMDDTYMFIMEAIKGGVPERIVNGLQKRGVSWSKSQSKQSAKFFLQSSSLLGSKGGGATLSRGRGVWGTQCGRLGRKHYTLNIRCDISHVLVCFIPSVTNPRPIVSS